MAETGLIRKQDAIDEIVAWTVNDRPDAEMPTDLIDRITGLPSANPDLSGYSDRLWKTAYDRGYEWCRQDAIDALMNDVTPYGLMDDDGNIESGCKDKDVVAMLYNLPSAQPERKTGRWIKISPADIYECSECGKNVMTADIDAYDFCHGCGADMRKPKLQYGDEDTSQGGLMSAT